MRSRLVPLGCCSMMMSTACAQVTYEAVALTGDPVPGLPAGYQFGNFTDSAIDDDGTVAIVAWILDEQQSPAGWGVWAGQPSHLQLIARSGEPAPGPGHPRTLGDSAGHWAVWISGGYIAFSNRTTSGHRAYFGGPLGGPMIRLAAEGDPAIGGGTIYELWSGWNMLRMHSGHIIFAALVGPGGVYWGGPIGNIQQLARTGEPAPGLPGYTFGQIRNDSAWRPAVTSDGTMYFASGLSGSTVGTASVWMTDADGLTLLAKRGDPAPTFPGGTLVWVREPVPDASGRIILGGRVDPADPHAQFIDASWYGTPGDWQRLIARNDPVPGAPQYTFSGNHSVRQNRYGDMVAMARVRHGEDLLPAILMGQEGMLSFHWGADQNVPGYPYGFSSADHPQQSMMQDRLPLLPSRWVPSCPRGGPALRSSGRPAAANLSPSSSRASRSKLPRAMCEQCTRGIFCTSGRAVPMMEAGAA